MAFGRCFRSFERMDISISNTRLLLWLFLILSRSESVYANSIVDIDAHEMQSLLTLKEILQLQGDIWQENRNPCSSWLGIACEDGHVVSVSLFSMKYQAVGPSQNGSLMLEKAVQTLSTMSFLRSFNATGFEFRGQLPDSLGKLGKLNALDLTGTALYGSLPASFKLLSRLNFLSLAKNNLTGSISPFVEGFYNLQYIDLSCNSFTSLLPFTLFFKASQLMYVDLSHNGFEGVIPPFMGNLVNLRHLALGHNFLQGSLPLNHLKWPHLEYLDISNNNLQGPIADSISQLKSLSYLNLAHNYFTGSIPSAISSCTKLQTLILDRNLLTDKLPLSMITLKNLVVLSLSSNNLSGRIPSKIFTLPRLTTLVLSHNLFFGMLPLNELKPALIQVFDISYNFLEGDIPESLFPVEKIMKNCFQGAPTQHSPKACKQFYRRIGISWQETQPRSGSSTGNNTFTWLVQGHTRKNKRLLVILGCAAGGAFVLVIAGFCALCNERHKGVLNHELNEGIREVVTDRGSSLDKCFQMSFSRFLGEPFSYDTLSQATNGFSSSNMLANGHSGELYKGTLEAGTNIVVKRVYTARKIELYLKEMEIFQRAFHRRLVTVLGYCISEPDEKFLVYEHMPCGDLASVLQTKEVAYEGFYQCPRRPLDWITRLKIGIGVAEGLTYLHHECSPPIVHGSLDHADEESTTLDRSKDVYDFGKLLLELLSGHSGITERRDYQTDSWVEWAVSLINIHDKEALYQLLDPSLVVVGDFLDEALVMAVVAKACLNPKVSKRPSIRHTLKALRNPMSLFQEEKTRSKLSWILSEQSWDTSTFGVFRSVGTTSSVAASEINDTVSNAGNSIYLVQNAAYVDEIEELSLRDIQEV
ncbi:hypothetical protein KP509_23G022300 [Ceratopteris richardii]|uniref:Protein kinase domain-containing protein n=1 Tax=Ceratopteris richardii TaxID=49495 RepID=A0A8T2S159_CERRI|nr:hypothetical protein KP509_23G022300 [Ceratopteris richardii]